MTILTAIKLKQTKRPKLKKISEELPVSLRTDFCEDVYKRSKVSGRSRPLISEPRIKEWQYWALITNIFPYDAAFSVNHMLIPKRVVSEDALTTQERQELQAVLQELSSRYDCQMTNFISKQSVKDHYHIHMLTFKSSRDDVKF